MTFDDIKKHYPDSLEEAAFKLNVSVATLYNWRKGGIPLKAQRDIEMRTGGALKASAPKRARRTPRPLKAQR